MTKKELGKLRYDRHYAHVGHKLAKARKTRPSDRPPMLIISNPFFYGILDEMLNRYPHI